MYKEGKFDIGDIDFSYEVKIYDEGFRHGINGSRVVALEIRQHGIMIAGYDRGWYIRPETEIAAKALEYVLGLFR